MDLPARRSDEDLRKLMLAPEDCPRGYLHHDDGSWSFVGDDGWPVSSEDFYADATAAIAAVTFAPIDADLVADSRRGLLSMPSVIDVEPLSVTDAETEKH